MKNPTFKIFLIYFLLNFGCSTRAKKKLHADNKNKIQLECQLSIENWIKNHATYPESYSSQKFEKVLYHNRYLNGIEIIPLRKYSVLHTFQLKDNSKSPLFATFEFELTPDYFIDHVHYKTEIINKNFIFPPNYDAFILQFGKPTTSDDTASWRLNQREELYNLSTEFNYRRRQIAEKSILDSIVNLIHQTHKNRNYHLPE